MIPVGLTKCRERGHRCCNKCHETMRAADIAKGSSLVRELFPALACATFLMGAASVALSFPQYRCRLLMTGVVPYGGGWAVMALEWGFGQPAAVILQPGSTARLTLQAGFWDTATGQPLPIGGGHQVRCELSQEAWAGNLRAKIGLRWLTPALIELRIPPDGWGDAALRLTSVWVAPVGQNYASQAAVVPLVVLVPRYVPKLDNDGVLEGYPLGSYPPGPEPPRWFTPVPDAAESYYLSPFILLGNMTCAQPARAPLKYTVVDYAIIEKLEKLQRVLSATRPGAIITPPGGHGGYRTPLHNARVGGATFSRHMWGDAFDFRVTQDGSDQLADLNGDGVISLADGEYLRAIVRELEARGEVRPGGCGIYWSSSSQGGPRLSFHVDARGNPVDWTED
jgi:hypothetical protein